jgi:drug/metabolite transporter (DMT)-like permease
MTVAATGAAVRPGGPVLRGVAWMVLTGLCFVGVTGVVKAASDALPAPQAAFLRYVFGLVLLLPMAPALARLRPSRGDMALLGARGLAHAAAVILWFYAIARIPIAEVTAMSYLNPVLVVLGGVLILREPLRPARLIAVALAILGVAIVLRPGFRTLDPGHLAMLGTAACFAASYLMAKPLTARHSAGTIVAVLSVMVTAWLAPFAAAVWVTPSAADISWMAAAAAFATGGHYCMTRAFALAPVSVVQPVAFLQLVWAVLMAWALFGEAPDALVILGGAVIVAGVALASVAGRERRRGSGNLR